MADSPAAPLRPTPTPAGRLKSGSPQEGCALCLLTLPCEQTVDGVKGRSFLATPQESQLHLHLQLQEAQAGLLLCHPVCRAPFPRTCSITQAWLPLLPPGSKQTTGIALLRLRFGPHEWACGPPHRHPNQHWVEAAAQTY